MKQGACRDPLGGFRVLAEIACHYPSKPTSRSNSSGPVRGSKIAGSESTPGASLREGGMATRSTSGSSMALWAGAWNAQFLFGLKRPPSDEK